MLELKNICFSANADGQEKEILKNINLTLDEKVIAFTGPNGGGKSTLAKIIMGIIKPTSGQILYNGEDITNLSITERANKGVAFAFQQPVRFKGITVSDLINIASGKINASLSGGELKRIEIATILARKSTFTIFDEPEAGIDLWSFNSLITVFERLSKITSGSILIISHQERILNIAERIIIIANGEVKSDGKSQEILPEILSQSACKILKDKAEA